MPGEPYAAIYASLPWHPKVLAVSEDDRLAAFGYYAAVCAYCQAYRTDGFLATEQLVAVFPCTHEQRTRYTSILISVRLFDATAGGIQVHDYLAHNKSKAEIEALAEKRTSAGHKGGVASGMARGSKRLKQVVEAPLEIAERSREEIAARSSAEPSEVNVGVPRKAPELDCELCGGTGWDRDEPCWCTT